MEFRTNYQPSIDEGVDFKIPSMTQQSQAEFSDINNIMAKYQQTGLYVGFSNDKTPQYGDFSLDIDYRTALEAVMLAEEQFESLPAAIRRRFNDDPAEFYEFCMNEKNRDEMIELGLIDKVEGVGTVTPLDVTVPTDTDSIQNDSDKIS